MRKFALVGLGVLLALALPAIAQTDPLEERVAALEAKVCDLEAEVFGRPCASPSTEASSSPSPSPVASPEPTPSPEPSSSPEPSPEPGPSPPLPPSTTGCLLSGPDPDGVTIPPGQVCEVDGIYEPQANVIVLGKLVMRTGDVLQFIGVNESAFVGGGLDPMASDVGLWVMGDGVLDVQGTPKAAWNRTGDSLTWSDSDELVVTPTAPNSMTFAPFVRGSAVPQAHPEVPPAEVLNLTRDVVISGTAGGRSHIFIRSTQPQTIRYATIRYMGPTGVLGRYPLHFHMAHEGSRGSLVEGVVVRDAGNHAFVPHMSNGITFRDTIAYNVLRDAYWWDDGDSTDDVTYERAVAAKVASWAANGGEDKFRNSGFRLGQGTGNRCIECVAVGVGGLDASAGFQWPENTVSGVWEFRDSVSHNNQQDGAFVWHNGGNVHPIVRFIAYGNPKAGVEHGAYFNNYHYFDTLLVGNGVGVELHAESLSSAAQRWERTRIVNSSVGFLGQPGIPQGTTVIICGSSFFGVTTPFQLNGLEASVLASC